MGCATVGYGDAGQGRRLCYGSNGGALRVCDLWWEEDDEEGQPQVGAHYPLSYACNQMEIHLYAALSPSHPPLMPPC